MGGKSRKRDQEHFARIPASVLESEAVKTLNHAAFKVLVILAAQYRGKNNGTLALTELYARQYGLSGRDTLYRSLRELRKRWLIIRTRKGIKSKQHFSLFALGWESITHRDGQPLDTPEPKNHRWLRWREADRNTWCKDDDLNNFQTDYRECSVPMVGSDTPVSVPILPDRLAISRPTIGNTSRVWRERPDGGDTDRAPAPHDSIPKAGDRDSTRTPQELTVCVELESDEFKTRLITQVRQHVRIGTEPHEIQRQLATQASAEQVAWALECVRVADGFMADSQRRPA